MVFRIVGNVPGIDVLLEAAEPVRQFRHARCDPRSSLGLRIAVECHGLGVSVVIGARRCIAYNRLDVLHLGNQPRLRCIGQVTVRKQYDWRHMPQRNAHCVDRGEETVARRHRRNYRYRRIGIASVYGLVQIRLFCLGRQTGRRTAALRVDDDKRQFRVYRKPHRLGFQRDARTRTRGDTDSATVRRADRSADRGDLVFRLEGSDSEVAGTRKPVQQGRCRRNRVRAKKHLAIRQLPGCSEPER